ncbi:flagellar basal body-associated FliL family protein [Ancylobacter polymorphus]|uniref:Flagellar protein FliL n=1 Tax=Ancylobacter polymorphus TaxID=223390 RepID=A0A9E6ZW10_9HYPH|nr:flagellar basal body-associated FliL family protein [Ancylobacter polymorphus]UOK72749.1 flagellar basal body-associated FliL family protein [Ancylobacter polymorphus]
MAAKAAAVKGDDKKSGGGLIVPLAILTLLAAGGGGGLGIQLATSVEKTVSEKAKEKPPEPDTPPLKYAGTDVVMEPMKAIVSNLAAPSQTFVRIEAAIIFKKDALPDPKIAIAQIRDDIMGYLRTLSLSQLEGPSGLLHLREDLTERAKLRTEGKIDELIIETMVVQ